MRVTIASRIFLPEPSAASFRLAALAEALAQAGHQVTVLTVRPPRGTADRVADGARGYRVRRWPVLRDRDGYVRGYLQYLSFDIPLFFRLCFARRSGVIVVEPPPTTGVCVRLAAWLRRTPYVYYAADVWSDAVAQTGSPAVIQRVLARVERLALQGASLVLAVSSGVQHRLAAWRLRSPLVLVGNGVDVSAFAFAGVRRAVSTPLFVYGGTASEWHGAEVFVRALALLQRERGDAALCFIGGGSERVRLARLAQQLGVTGVDFLAPMPAEELSQWLRAATGSLASVRPGAGYDFAFPTKLYASVATGVPVVFAGVGPAATFVTTEVAGRPVGIACAYDPAEVAGAMLRLIDAPPSAERRAAVSGWGHQTVDITVVAERIRVQLERRFADVAR